MKDFNCRPDTPIYNSLIHPLTEPKCMDMEEAMLKRMCEWGLSPDIITYNALIKGFCDLAQIEDAQRLVGEMTKHGCTPNVVTYTILLNGSSKARIPEKDLDILDKMLEK